MSNDSQHIQKPREVRAKMTYVFKISLALSHCLSIGTGRSRGESGNNGTDSKIDIYDTSIHIQR